MPDKPDVVESFRESLKDVIPVIEKLAPHCTGFDDLLGMVNLALENTAQARILLKIITETKK